MSSAFTHTTADPNTHNSFRTVFDQKYYRRDQITVERIMTGLEEASLLFKMKETATEKPQYRRWDWVAYFFQQHLNEKNEKRNNIHDLLHFTTENTWIRLYKFFKPFIGEITKDQYKDAYAVYEAKKVIRNSVNAYEYFDKERGYRLYPMPITKYDEFARKVYEKRGHPRYNCRIITGIKWGKAKTQVEGTRYRRRGGRIISRTFGMKIETVGVDGIAKKRLEITVAR